MISIELSILGTMERNHPNYRMDIGYLRGASLCRELQVKVWEGGSTREKMPICLSLRRKRVKKVRKIVFERSGGEV